MTPMLPKKKLSVRRQRILDFIQEFIQDNGIPPTVRDIQKSCDVSSTSVVDYNLRLLDRDGYLNRRPDVARGIELLDDEGQPVSNAPKVSIVGKIAAGQPLPVFSSEEAVSGTDLDSIDVSPELSRRHGKLFGLTVHGTSMIDALIDDGDVVIIEATQRADNGDMVAAWLEDQEEATLKRFYLEGDMVRLQPENASMDPIMVPASNVAVRGKVVGVIRTI